MSTSEKMNLDQFCMAVGLHQGDLAKKANIPLLAVQHAARGEPIAEVMASKILKVLSAEFGRPITAQDIGRFRTC